MPCGRDAPLLLSCCCCGPAMSHKLKASASIRSTAYVKHAFSLALLQDRCMHPAKAHSGSSHERKHTVLQVMTAIPPHACFSQSTQQALSSPANLCRLPVPAGCSSFCQEVPSSDDSPAAQPHGGHCQVLQGPARVSPGCAALHVRSGQKT